MGRVCHLIFKSFTCNSFLLSKDDIFCASKETLVKFDHVATEFLKNILSHIRNAGSFIHKGK